jgi:hypothetical protein
VVKSLAAILRNGLADGERVGPSVEIPFSKAAKRVLKTATDEGYRAGAVTPLHLVLGLTSEGGRAAEILAEHGVTAHAVRKFLDARLPVC